MLLFYLSLIDSAEDRAKVTKIYEQYLDWMLKIAYHYLRNEKDAEDAVNDVFLNIISTNCAIPLSSDNDTKAYLFICIRNSVYRILELNKKHKTVDIDEFFSLSSTTNTEDEVIKKSNSEMLRHIINTLPPIYKDVLILYVNFEKTLQEVSEELGIPLKTAETRLRRAKIMLKERIGDIKI